MSGKTTVRTESGPSAVRVSAHHGAVATRRLASESQAGSTAVAAGGAEGACFQAETACGGYGVGEVSTTGERSQRGLELRLCVRPDDGWAGVEVAADHRRVYARERGLGG